MKEGQCRINVCKTKLNGEGSEDRMGADRLGENRRISKEIGDPFRSKNS